MVVEEYSAVWVLCMGTTTNDAAGFVRWIDLWEVERIVVVIRPRVRVLIAYVNYGMIL